jgi:hypothetical protein
VAFLTLEYSKDLCILPPLSMDEYVENRFGSTVKYTVWLSSKLIKKPERFEKSIFTIDLCKYRIELNYADCAETFRVYLYIA